jgi:hypothetical protein
MAESNKAGELVIKCFHARTVAHIQHLQTESYSQHKSLEEFYINIVPLADKFAESYMGAYGSRLDEFPGIFILNPDPMSSLEALQTWITDNREEISELSSCQNIIDEILELCFSTIYKLSLQ